MIAVDLSRPELEDLIESLIAMLDDADVNVDDEPDDTGIADMDGLIEQRRFSGAMWVA